VLNTIAHQKTALTQQAMYSLRLPMRQDRSAYSDDYKMAYIYYLAMWFAYRILDKDTF